MAQANTGLPLALATTLAMLTFAVTNAVRRRVASRYHSEAPGVMTWTQALIGLAFTCAVAFTIVLEYATYAATGSRWIEAFVACLITAPFSRWLVLVSCRVLQPPRANHARDLLAKMYGQVALAALILADVYVSAMQPHEWENDNEMIVAFGLSVLVAMFFNVLCARERYLHARANAFAKPLQA